VIYRVIGKNLK